MPIERGVGKASMLILCRLTSRYHAQIPVAIPPNLDPAVAKQVIEYRDAPVQIEASKAVIVFTGAGISTACGIPDFRY